ncbi:MAG TPA: hypothetical protein VGI74_25925 [Streptosporangiaceae bacterium]
MATRQERATSFGTVAAEYYRLRSGPSDEAIRCWRADRAGRSAYLNS